MGAGLRCSKVPNADATEQRQQWRGFAYDCGSHIFEQFWRHYAIYSAEFSERKCNNADTGTRPNMDRDFADGEVLHPDPSHRQCILSD